MSETPKTPSQTEIQKDEIIIRTEKLAKYFGKDVAVRKVTMEIPRGKIFGFIGPSGCGKTTTIRMLTGYYTPSEGRVEVLGHTPTNFTRRLKERIGYMPQLFVLYPHLSVWENLNFAASIYGMPLSRRERMEAVLDFVELNEHRDKLARNISGGMQRRLSLAATLIHNPDLIFLDEPTAGIDPMLRQRFWEHFRELQKENRTFFITTQYVGEAAYCDLVGIMDEGELLTVDTPKGLRYRAYGGDIVDICTTEPLTYKMETSFRELPFVRGEVLRTGEQNVRVIVDEASTAIPDLMEWCQNQQCVIESMEEYLPPFEEVFVQIIQAEEESHA